MKKTILVILSYVLISQMSFGQMNSIEDQTHSLTVSITGFESNNGKVFVGVYNDRSNWLKTRFKSETLEITNQTAKTTFADLPAGEYAVSLFHDENDNGKMDANWMGIPSEPYACSRGAKGFMGPPKWKNAVMTIDSSKDIIIKF